MDISAILAGLEEFERDSIASAKAGLVDGMQHMEQTAKATTAYGDQTGTNRTATVGYVPGVNDDRFAKAVEAVEEGRPGHAEVNTLSGEANTLIGVLTTPTDYAAGLERNNAGARSYLEPALIQDMHLVTRTIADAIREGK